MRDEVRKVRVGPDTTDTAVVEMPLSSQYDAIGVVLLTTSIDTFTISDLPFTSFTQGPWGEVNFKFQHWAEITPPTLTSVTHEDGYITLRWSNGPPTMRSIDSTVVYRNGVELDLVPGADSTNTHPSPGNGTWRYTLKHVSWPAALAPSRDLSFPNSDTSNAISITLGSACARRAESTSYTSTWQLTDQYLSAGCSELGASKRFRWYKAGGIALTTWSPDTLFEFAGHTGTGAQIVILKDSNTTTDATALDTLSFSVFSGFVQLAGETYIPDKAQYLYTATAGGQAHAGQWFERYDDGPQWYPATAYDQTSMTRIWPKGEYTVDLRQHKYTGTLRRGRLLIEVCSVAGCSPPLAPPSAAARVTDPADTWDLFGAGPWIGWGSPDLRPAVRFYDLWGMPDRASAFTAATWLLAAGGQVRDAQAGWQVDWTARAVAGGAARLVELAVTGTRGRPYVFSLALDPDLGADAADDVASYDGERGLVLVADGARAVGFLLQAGSDNAVVTVQEYGVGHWAPATPAGAWAAQRERGVRLRGTPRDVQLVLSSAETTGNRTWQFVVIRGATAAAVRATADEVLRAQQ